MTELERIKAVVAQKLGQVYYEICSIPTPGSVEQSVRRRVLQNKQTTLFQIREAIRGIESTDDDGFNYEFKAYLRKHVEDALRYTARFDSRVIDEVQQAVLKVLKERGLTNG